MNRRCEQHVSIGAVAIWSLFAAACACHVANYRPWSSPQPPAPPAGPLRDVLLVGNSVSGTVSVIDGRTFESLGTINAQPDISDVLKQINDDPVRKVLYAAIRKGETIRRFEPADGDRFIDDLFLSPDGTTLYVSRANLGDVAAFDLLKPDFPLIWRTRIPGGRADHATISPDGTRIVVSASLAEQAIVLDTKSMGAIVGCFKTSLLPHQNDYSHDGKHIYNGSLGKLFLPPEARKFKLKRGRLTVADAQTYGVIRTYDFDVGVRPTVISDDEKTMYAQLSFLNGLIKYDLVKGRIVQTVTEPPSAFAVANYPSERDYPHDSAHHGLALSADGTRLCDAGTIDNNVSIVSTADMTVERTIQNIGMIPYWATTSVDGKHCFVSLSGDNQIAVVDYETGKVMYVPVGKFPQRNRLGGLSPVVHFQSQLSSTSH